MMDKQPELYLDDEGLLHLTANDFIGQSIALLGIKGGGKTNTAAVIAEELLAAGVPLAVVDIAGEYHSLKEAHPRLTIIGRSLTCKVDIEVGAHNARQVAEKAYINGASVIIDMSAVPQDAREELLEAYFSQVWTLSAVHRIPLIIYLEEAHNWIPQRSKTSVTKLFMSIAAEGRKRGLSLLMVSPRSAWVDKGMLSQADLLFLHRVRHPIDVSVYIDLIPRQKRWVEEQVNKLKPGQSLVLIGDQVIRAKMRLRRTTHIGFTPTLDHVPSGQMSLLDLMVNTDG